MIQGDRVYNAGSLVARAGAEQSSADEFINERRVARIHDVWHPRAAYAAQAGGAMSLPAISRSSQRVI